MVGDSPKARPGTWGVVLGCTSGNGRAIAAQLARDPGVHVFGAHRGNYPEGADALRAEITGADRRAEMYQGDVGTPDGVQAGADALLEVAGPRSVRVFVHSIANASVGCFLQGGRGRYRAFVPQNFHKTFDSMAHSFAWWAQALVDRDLLAPGGRLLGLTNPIGDSLIHNFALITAAKAALEVYVKHLARELGRLGHRVNLLNFGVIETPAVKAGFGPLWPRFAHVCEQINNTERLTTAEDVARTVSMLCSDAAAGFNGATIDFSGGQCQAVLDALVYNRWDRDAHTTRPTAHGEEEP